MVTGLNFMNQKQMYLRKREHKTFKDILGQNVMFNLTTVGSQGWPQNADLAELDKNLSYQTIGSSDDKDYRDIMKKESPSLRQRHLNDIMRESSKEFHKTSQLELINAISRFGSHNRLSNIQNVSSGRDRERGT